MVLVIETKTIQSQQTSKNIKTNQKATMYKNIPY